MGTAGNETKRAAGSNVPATVANGKVEHFTTAERAARGKGGPRRGSAQGARRSGSRRRTGRDPVELLEEQAQTRVPELVPIRYGRMLVSPFTFYRGAALPDGGRSRRRSRAPACTPSSAATRTSRTSASSRRRTGGSSSASTTSTRRSRARSSGTSSAWSRASPSPGATAASTRRARAGDQRRPSRAPTARRCASSRRCATSTSGTRALDIEEIVRELQRRGDRRAA